MHRTLSILAILLLVGLTVGCSGRPKLAEVEGRVLIDGEPAEGIEVIYIPDPEFGNKGRYSKGTTDEDGYFKLKYDEEGAARADQPAGAAVGPCRVTLRDLLPSYTSRSENPQPSRISQDYKDANKSPLRRDVEKGVINNHVFELDFVESGDGE